MKVKVTLFITCWGLLTLLHLQAKKVAVFDEFGFNISDNYFYKLAENKK
jgi:peroxiredoxin family protein